MEFTNSKYCIFINKNELLPDRVMSKKGYITIKMMESFQYNCLKELNKNIEMMFNNKIYNCKYISK